MRQTFLSPFICLLLVLSFVSLTACQKNNAPSHNSEKSKEIYASDESIHIPVSYTHLDVYKRQYLHSSFP